MQRPILLAAAAFAITLGGVAVQAHAEDSLWNMIPAPQAPKTDPEASEEAPRAPKVAVTASTAAAATAGAVTGAGTSSSATHTVAVDTDQSYPQHVPVSDRKVQTQDPETFNN